jgi:site-specific recombinase XerD
MAATLGYLIKRPNGRYSARFRKPSGRWTQESLGTSKAAEAKIKFDLWKQERLQKRVAAIHDVEPIPLKQLAEEHLANVRRHQAKSWHLKQQHYLYRTERDRPDSPKKIIEWFAPSQLSTKVTPNQIRDYTDYLKDSGLKAVTCNKVLSCLKAMFRFGEERGYIAENASPARRVKLLKSDSEVHDAFLTFEQYERLKAKACEKRLGVRPTLFAQRIEWLMLACNSGLRPGEQAMLEFSDVDLVHGFIHVQAKPDLGFHIKNYQDRYIPLVPEARSAVEAMLACRKPATLSGHGGKAVPVDFIFHRPDGSPWGDLGESMERLFADAGLNAEGTRRRDRITLHSLRHTFASWLAIAGVPLRRIQELLGHKSIVTTERYSHLGSNGQQVYYDELASAVAGGFVTSGRLVANSTQAPIAQNVPNASTRDFVTTRVTSTVFEGALNSPQLLEKIGGGGATRTPDLGIMRPSL